MTEEFNRLQLFFKTDKELFESNKYREIYYELKSLALIEYLICCSKIADNLIDNLNPNRSSKNRTES